MKIKNLVLLSLWSLIFITQACKNKQKVVEQAHNIPTKGVPVKKQEVIEPVVQKEKPVRFSKYAKEDYRFASTKHFDLIHTRLEVKFDWKKAHLFGNAEITLKPHFYKSDKVILDAKGFDIHKIERIENKTRIPLKFDYDGLRTRIYLDKAFTRDQTIKLFVDYTAKPNELGTVVKADHTA